MEFCPKCGSVIIGKNCAKCDYRSEHAVKLESSQQITPKQEVVVVNEGENDVNPVIEARCEKCKHHEAYFWTSQTRAGDEAETRFFKCTKCKHTWREYR